MKKINELVRNAAASEILQIMNSPEKSNNLRNELRNLPDSSLNFMGKVGGVPESQLAIYRAIVRNQDNELVQKFKYFNNCDTLKTGDIILVAGKNAGSKALLKSQRAFYKETRSSHVAVVHADFICIDAMPKAGVTNRLVSEILHDVEDDWRIIRLNELSDDKSENLQKSCAYYLAQPYKILPSRKPAKKFSYCSELARKVYIDSEINNSGIPKSPIIKPCDFDKLADHSKNWTDITENVRPYVELCIEYAPILKVMSKIFIDGLKLNKARAEERVELIKTIRSKASNGYISEENAKEAIKVIQDANDGVNFKFWNTWNNKK